MPEALIVGAGPGLSASLARRLTAEGWRVHLAARHPERLRPLSATIGATLHRCDASEAAEVAALFAVVPAPDLVAYNAGARLRGPIADLDPAAVRAALEVGAYGGFLVAQQAARAMLRAGRGTILLTGASASIKGFAQSAPFAMGKFALRGLAQSLARELHPQGVHVAHVVVDGVIRSAQRPDPGDESTLDPDAIACAMLGVAAQPRSAWSDEIVLRPWRERF